MENAIKYGDGKEISISFSEEEGCILIAVKNSGCTLPDTDLPHIFESFWRGANAENLKGSGLGLCIVKNILQQHQAEYGVESKQNQGSTFWFALEVLDQQQTEKFVKKQNQ